MWGASGLSINDQPHSCLATCFRAIDSGRCYRVIISCLSCEPNLATMSVVIYITSVHFPVSAATGRHGRADDAAVMQLESCLQTEDSIKYRSYAKT